jgi:hypothetical protein
MKILAVIFALLVFSLSVSSYTLERHCCDVYQTCDNMPDGDDDCPTGCSPFHQCAFCNGFTVPVIYQGTPVISQGKPLILIPYKQPRSSAYIGDIWQPPKLN